MEFFTNNSAADDYSNKTDEIFHRVKSNDASLAGLTIDNLSCKPYESSNDRIASLGRAVGNNTCIEEIVFCRMGQFDLMWWKLLADGMKENRSIKKISFGRFDDRYLSEIISYLGLFFEMNPSLERIVFFRNHQMDGEGMKLLSLRLSKRNRPLEGVRFDDNPMNDDMIRDFFEPFQNNARLTPKAIELNSYDEPLVVDVGRDGLECIANLLGNSDCTMENLRLDIRHVDDDMIKLFADALTKSKNNSLKTLVLKPLEKSTISKNGWNVFDTVVCNNSSVDATYDSNHTLSLLGQWHYQSHPGLLSQHLCWNFLCADKQFVARKKVFTTHFVGSGMVSGKSLNGMESSLLVRLIEFVDRVIEENGGEASFFPRYGRNLRSSFLYQLFRRHHNSLCKMKK
ncbi:hypothetical protein ACHAXS_007603 [Conticribra weissflogii]